jgi:uncharacterized membrane protein (UPF0182 family)
VNGYYRDNGVVVGASYTDVQVELPVLWLLIGLAVLASLASLVNVWVRTYKFPAAGAVLLFGSSLVLGQVFPALFQRVFVKPSELQLEKPYLQHNISLTQQAYNLQQITVKPFPAEQNLTFQKLQDNKPTIENSNRSRGTKLLKTICCDSDFRKNGQNMRSHDPV